MPPNEPPAAPPRPAAAQRAWLAAAQLALALPFVTVRSCSDDSTRTFTGVGYYLEPEHLSLAVCLLGVLVVLLAFPWRGDRGPGGVAGLALRAWLALFGFVTASVGPVLAFLFDTVQPRVGWFLHAGSWALTVAGYLGLAVALLRRLPRGAEERVRSAPTLVALALGLGLAALPLVRAPEDPLEGLLLIAVAVAMAAPLAVAALALGRGPAPRVRALLLVAVVLTLALDVAFAWPEGWAGE